MWGIVLWPCFYDIIWHCSSDDGTMSARSQFFRNLCRPAYRSTSERVPRCGNFAKQFRSYAFELLLYNWALGLVVSIQQNLLRLVRQIPLNRRSIQSWFSLVACGGRGSYFTPEPLTPACNLYWESYSYNWIWRSCVPVRWTQFRFVHLIEENSTLVVHRVLYIFARVLGRLFCTETRHRSPYYT